MTNLKSEDAMAQVAAAFADIAGLKFVRVSPDRGSIHIQGCARRLTVRANHSAQSVWNPNYKGLADQVLITSDRTKTSVHGGYRNNETRRFPVGKDGTINAESMRAAAYKLADDSIKAEAFDNDRARSAAVKEQAREAVKAKLRERGLMHIGKDFGWPTFRGIEGRIHVNHDANIVLEFGALSFDELMTLLNEEVRS